MWAPVVFIVLGVLLNVNDRKGWGWSMIVLGVLIAAVIVVL